MDVKSDVARGDNLHLTECPSGHRRAGDVWIPRVLVLASCGNRTSLIRAPIRRVRDIQGTNARVRA